LWRMTQLTPTMSDRLSGDCKRPLILAQLQKRPTCVAD
jgi:hypothetical protein